MNSFTKQLTVWKRSIYNFNQHNRDQWVAQKAKELPAGALVLDIGAGKGRYRELFSHCRYMAQDFGKEPGTIGNYTKLDIQSDITAIPVKENVFDTLLCFEVLEHVPNPVKAIQEINRILRPGGNLILSAPLGSFLHQEPYHFYGGFTPHWYKYHLENNGFKISSITPNKGFFSLLGQETQRFISLTNPFKSNQTSCITRILISFLWLIALPFACLLPLVADYLDKIAIESTATVGYHVEAEKKEKFD